VRVRLRPLPTQADLDRLYAAPHQHTDFADHRVRVDVTTAIAGHFLRAGGTVADLSCGDAAIARRLEASHSARLILGDYAAGDGYDYHGPIEQTISKLRWKEADLFICSETLEHLDDPDAVLGQIRQKTDQLILTTPDGETDDANPEHVWGWDADGVRELLAAAQFTPLVHTTLDLRPAGFVYAFQIWACR
jgi:hypothetical protein